MEEMRLSPSRMSDFKICPQLFKFRSIDRIPEPPSLAATQGTLVHLALQYLFDRPAAERTVHTALSLLDQAWDECLAALPAEERVVLLPDAETEAAARAATRRHVENYFALEDPTQLEPAGRELRLDAVLGDVRAVGIIDRLDRRSDGSWVISDYKTGRTPELERSQSRFFGLEVYAVLVHALTGEVPSKLRLLFLDTGETFVVEPTAGEVEHTGRVVRALADAIGRATTKDDWRPRPSGFCRVCSFQSICPSWAASDQAAPDQAAADEAASAVGAAMAPAPA